MTAQALVLDFGGVISRTMFETHRETEAALGLAPGTLTWRGPFDPSGDALWRAMQADEITERAYWRVRTRETAALIGCDWPDMSDFVKAARGADPEAILRPEALAAIAAAKAAGRRLAILSNELDLFYGEGFAGRIAVLADFDLVVDATYTGILKPDPRAYAFVTDGLGLAARDCVFVDDQIRNTRGAEAIGMQAVQFDVARPADSYAEALRLLGVETSKESGHGPA